MQTTPRRHRSPYRGRRAQGRCAAAARAAGALAVISLLAAGCLRAPVHYGPVRYVMDRRVDFSRYATFAFAPETGRSSRTVPPEYLDVVQDPSFDVRLRQTIANGLVGRGLRPARPGVRSDLLITYDTIIGSEAGTVNNAGYGLTWQQDPMVTRPGFTRAYKEGTLIIDAIDPRTGRIIWSGTSSTPMRDLEPATMRRTVLAILAHYPLYVETR